MRPTAPKVFLTVGVFLLVPLASEAFGHRTDQLVSADSLARYIGGQLAGGCWDYGGNTKCKYEDPGPSNCACDKNTKTICAKDGLGNFFSATCKDEAPAPDQCWFQQTGALCEGTLQLCNNDDCTDCKNDPDGTQCKGKRYRCTPLKPANVCGTDPK